jgi:hypothetical protein
MPKFRKKPVVIEARQIPQGRGERQLAELQALARWVGDSWGGVDVVETMDALLVTVKSLEGNHRGTDGDWIIHALAGFTTGGEPMKALMLMGVYRDDLLAMPDRVTPVIAGCVDETVWAHEDQEDTERRWAPLRAAFDPSGTDYDWREVWVTLDEAASRKHFTIPAVVGTVEPVAPGQVERRPVPLPREAERGPRRRSVRERSRHRLDRHRRRGALRGARHDAAPLRSERPRPASRRHVAARPPDACDEPRGRPRAGDKATRMSSQQRSSLARKCSGCGRPTFYPKLCSTCQDTPTKTGKDERHG